MPHINAATAAAARWLRSLPPLRLLALCIPVAVFAAIPLLLIGFYSVQAGWSGIRPLVFRPLIAELLGNTLALCGTATAGCVALGTALAWLVERTSLPWRSAWLAVLSAPLTIPAFINSYAWITVQPGLHGLTGSTIVATLSYYPLVLLPVAAAVRGLDPATEESARALGSGPVSVFVRVVLPRLRPALLGGALLVALHLLAEYGAIEQLRYPTFATAIIAQYQSTFASTAANVLAAVLVVCCLAFVTIEVLLRGRVRTARLGSGTPRPAVPVRLGRWTAPVILALLGLLGLAIGVPAYSVGHWLTYSTADAWAVDALVPALWSTAQLGALAAGAAVVAGFPMAWLAVRHRSGLTTVLERGTYLASAVPGVVVGLALVSVSIRYARPLYQTTSLAVAAYVMLFLPRAMVSLRSAIGQAPPGLDEASRALGHSAPATFRRVTVPLTAPGILAGAALVFLAVSTELTATLLLAPTGTHTLATEFWAATSEIDYPRAAPYAVCLILLSVPAAYLLLRQSTKGTAS
ncbi:ABC transporter permease [Dactylosporangium sucinum]|uniref:Iron ABC transporter permease n=1 Tax=Dactylosporangium sucinum TaxID=1424081 RepID=A0A917WSP8_9ACTN|nr:iron ABC transporter permease [Dactylosporangium sucinum]GGM26140.1 iron ABC transporter permease [Dactylosporangium sucinum]